MDASPWYGSSAAITVAYGCPGDTAMLSTSWRAGSPAPWSVGSPWLAAVKLWPASVERKRTPPMLPPRYRGGQVGIGSARLEGRAHADRVHDIPGRQPRVDRLPLPVGRIAPVEEVGPGVRIVDPGEEHRPRGAGDARQGADADARQPARVPGDAGGGEGHPVVGAGGQPVGGHRDVPHVQVREADGVVGPGGAVVERHSNAGVRETGVDGHPLTRLVAEGDGPSS